MSKVNRVPETLKELLYDEEFIDYTQDEVMQIIIANRWGKDLSDMQHAFRASQAPTFEPGKITPQQVRAIKIIRYMLAGINNQCPECGYEATIYNFRYCPLCGTRCGKKKGA